LELLGITKMLHGERLGYHFSVTRAIMGHGKVQVTCAPEPDPLSDIRLESGDIVELIEGDKDVVPKVEETPDGAFRWS
jgi:hypothetical protein